MADMTAMPDIDTVPPCSVIHVFWDMYYVRMETGLCPAKGKPYFMLYEIQGMRKAA